MAENSAHLCSSMFFPTETSYLSVPAAIRTARRRIFYPIVLYVLVPVRLLAMAVPRWHWMAQAAVLIGALGLGYWYWRMAAGRWLFWAFSGVDDVRSLFAFSNFDGKGISIGLEQIQKLPSQQPEHLTFWLKTHEQLFGGTPPSPTKDDPGGAGNHDGPPRNGCGLGRHRLAGFDFRLWRNCAALEAV